MILTEEILIKSGINKEWLNILIDNFEEYNICSSENEEENLNYSANTLLKIFPKYFKDIEESK
ncbi:hypothetical protein [Brachyspira sp.]|uniref:hypothetical protein n=1 Tax=Brachyspira sp. TaxID=1977261 RepID=UPI0026070F51|nr:hypothetical protein [Brachyspira sp.]